MKSASERSPHLLVVDDDILTLNVSQRRLSRHGFRVTTCRNAPDALELLSGDEPPDLVLLDIAMPQMSGLECLKAIRNNPSTQRLPVILTSARTGNEDIVQGLHLGANDYVNKPIDLPMLLARIRTHLRMAEAIHRLETQTHMLKQLAAVDELTGTFNRRSLNAALERELETARRKRRSLSLLMIDIDHFKRVNDTHGHPVGDEVIRGLAARIDSLLRSSDLLCRYGGEEFCVLLPETDQESAEQVADRLLQGIAAHDFDTKMGPLSITVSIGLTTVGGRTKRRASDIELLEQADKALFHAKRAGRNRLSRCVNDTLESVTEGPGPAS